MKRTFIYTDDKSSKFWSIEVSGNEFTVNYGKTGTAGQTQTKSFADEATCTKEADKLIAEKTKKGYTERNITVSKTSKNEELYKQLSDASSFSEALMEHFSYLADSEGFMPVLTAIMNQAKSVSLDESRLMVHFPDDKEFCCWDPSTDDLSKWPASFRKLVEKHELIVFPDDGGWALELGDWGSFEPDMLEEGDDATILEMVDDPSDLLCPFTDYSDWWIYHPENKNPQGEPMLCLASHEGCDIAEYVSCNAGALFLSKIASYLNLDKLIPAIEVVDDTDTECEEECGSISNQPGIDDDDVYDLLSESEKKADVSSFIAELEKLSKSGTLLPKGADALILHTSNTIANCLNKNIDSFPIFEALARFFPNANRIKFRDQLSYNVPNFIMAIKEHKELYPQLKSAYMNQPIGNEETAEALYHIAKRLAAFGMIHEAMVELKRIEDAKFTSPYWRVTPSDFPEQIRDEVAHIAEAIKQSKK